MFDNRGAEQGGDCVEDAHIHPVGEKKEDVVPVSEQILHGGEIGDGLALLLPRRPLALSTVRRTGGFILKH